MHPIWFVVDTGCSHVCVVRKIGGFFQRTPIRNSELNGVLVVLAEQRPMAEAVD